MPERRPRRGPAGVAGRTLCVALLGLASLIEAAAPHAAAARSPSTAVTTKRAGIMIVLAGGPGPDEVRISLSADGRTYLIDSSRPLEAGGGVCANPTGNPDQLDCPAAAIAAFLFNGGPGGNTVIVARTVPVPVTLRGGSGNDLFVGGGGDDTLIGGPGENVLVGRGRSDRLYGGPGDDLLIGGPGHDVCNGGPGENAALGCRVRKNIAVSCRSLHELRAAAGPSRCARWARRHPLAISRLSSLGGLVKARLGPVPRPRAHPPRSARL